MLFGKSTGLKGKDLINIHDMNKDQINALLDRAAKMESCDKKKLDGKMMANLFFEPSTRTRLSFEAAMKRMGGEVIGFDHVDSTSLKKGESFKDTIKMVDQYADVIVIRHPSEGSAKDAAEISKVPVINAGDGSNQHPTQTLVDLYTIRKEKKKIEGLTIGFLGDLKFGRTVHSLATAAAEFDCNLVFISPQELRLSDAFLNGLGQKGVKYEVTNDLMRVADQLDVLYVTRIQKERFEDEEKYNQLAGSYKINKAMLSSFKPSVLVMHPLPRVDEIAEDVDDTKNQAYFKQAANAVAVRKAILAEVFGL
jgi:aspartate carbamoyltransferase catalytic subunit